MSLLRIFAVMLVVVCFTFVGCSEDTGQTPGDTTGVEKGDPDNKDDTLDDGSGAPKDQPDDAETDDDAPADDAPADDAPADDAGDADAPADDAPADDAPAAEATGDTTEAAPAAAKKDGE